MRSSRFTDEQQVQAVRQVDAGTPAVEVCRKLGITEQTFYRWRKKFGHLGLTEVRELKQLRDENRRLKKIVADLTLDKTILRDALGKKW
jgi:putative transposase